MPFDTTGETTVELPALPNGRIEAPDESHHRDAMAYLGCGPASGEGAVRLPREKLEEHMIGRVLEVAGLNETFWGHTLVRLAKLKALKAKFPNDHSFDFMYERAHLFATEHACNWTTCACGKVDDLPRMNDGSPEDDMLFELGIYFYSDIESGDFLSATNVLVTIQREAARVMANG